MVHHPTTTALQAANREATAALLQATTLASSLDLAPTGRLLVVVEEDMVDLLLVVALLLLAQAMEDQQTRDGAAGKGVAVLVLETVDLRLSVETMAGSELPMVDLLLVLHLTVVDQTTAEDHLVRNPAVSSRLLRQYLPSLYLDMDRWKEKRL